MLIVQLILLLLILQRIFINISKKIHLKGYKDRAKTSVVFYTLILEEILTPNKSSKNTI